MEIKDLVDALESLRKKHKLSEKSLCEGIISARTYRRYIFLDSNIPYDILSQLLNRLNTSLYAFLFDTEVDLRIKYHEENKLVTLLFNDQFEEAKILHDTLDLNYLHTSRAKTLLPLYLPKLEAYLGYISELDQHAKQIEALKLKQLMKLNTISQGVLYVILDIVDHLNENDASIVMTMMMRIVCQEMTVIPVHMYYAYVALRIYMILYLKLENHLKYKQEKIKWALNQAQILESQGFIYEFFNDVFERHDINDFPYLKTYQTQLFHSQLISHPNMSLQKLKNEVVLHKEELLSSFYVGDIL
jgi:transcriptional regulator with XRE-family HTH domain